MKEKVKRAKWKICHSNKSSPLCVIKFAFVIKLYHYQFRVSNVSLYRIFNPYAHWAPSKRLAGVGKDFLKEIAA
jgi:hypothetical protein